MKKQSKNRNNRNGFCAKSANSRIFAMRRRGNCFHCQRSARKCGKVSAKEFNIEHFTGDWRETVEYKDVDLICITTPPDLHKEMTLFALERGKHILCEKPMAMNVAEAEEMTEKAEKVGVLALIDHELRFQNGRQKAGEILQNGEIGKIINAKYNFRNASRGSLDVPWNWWSDEKQGGGALGAIGSHIIDSFNLVFGGGNFERFLPTANSRQRTARRKIRRNARSYDRRRIEFDSAFCRR